ncbi:MAG: hypothetical protein H7839_14080 [Magnetococcus sp. YQC-5]
MAVLEVRCPECNGLNVVKYGRQPNGKQRYLCQDPNCGRRIFLFGSVQESSMVRMPAEMRHVIERALSGGTIEETARELRLPTGTVAEVFQVLARFNAPPAGVTRQTNTLRRRAAG